MIAESASALQAPPTSPHTDSDAVAWWNMSRAIPIRPYASMSSAPRVPFSSPTAYDQALDAFVRAYARFLRDMVRAWMSFPGERSRIVWTRRDMVVNGLADFDEIHSDGLRVMLALTNNTGANWCERTNTQLGKFLISCARTYSRSWRDPLGYTVSHDIDEMYMDKFTIGLQNEMVTTLYENIDLFDDLFHANFVAWHDGRGRLNAVLTRHECEHMLLAFLLGTHPRAGVGSHVLELQADVAKLMLWSLIHTV